MPASWPAMRMGAVLGVERAGGNIGWPVGDTHARLRPVVGIPVGRGSLLVVRAARDIVI